DGATSWTAWANSKDGKVDFSITEAKNRRFIGTYTGLTQSTNYLDYKWIDMSANVVIGTQNLLDGTKSFSGSWFTEGTIFETTKISEYPFEFKKWKSGNKVSHTIEFDVKAGVTYTFTAAIARENAGRLYFYLYDLFANHITSNTPRETIIENVTTDIQMFKVTFVPLRDGKIKPRFAMLASDAGWFMTGGYMLVKGNKSGDWQESEADKASNLDSKADGAFTVEQLNAIAEEQRLMKANLEAAASLQEVQDKAKELLDQIKKIEDGQKVSEQTMISNANRVVQILAKLENVQLVTEAITQYMSYSNDGLVIKMKDGTSSVRVTTDRIAFYSGGTETAFISQGYLQIESGVFTLRLRIGSFLFEESSKGRLQIKKIRGIGG
ncbi:N-acetylmuramoyl-L-alanine amidase, partial [Streptococcus agalactiae]